MLNLVLFEPEIPNNTGSLIRLSANMGAKLHLIKPYGFEINDKRLRRAGLDYKDLANVYEYENFDATGSHVQDRAALPEERRAGVVRQHDAHQGLPHRHGHGLGRAQAVPPGRPQAQGVPQEAAGGAERLQVLNTCVAHRMM